MAKCGTSLKMTGGVGAATYGEAVYGSAGQQQAIPGTNVIAMNDPSTIKGGKKTKKNNGGNVLSELAVPVSLLYVNHTFSQKKSLNKKNKFHSRKNKKSLKNRRRSFRNYKK